MKIRRGYGIEYKNLYSKDYCIIWSSSDVIADALYNVLLVLDHPDSTPEDVANAKEDLEFYLDSLKVQQICGINDEDITIDNRYYLDNEIYIEILNAPTAFEVYI